MVIWMPMSQKSLSFFRESKIIEFPTYSRNEIGDDEFLIVLSWPLMISPSFGGHIARRATSLVDENDARTRTRVRTTKPHTWRPTPSSRRRRRPRTAAVADATPASRAAPSQRLLLASSHITLTRRRRSSRAHHPPRRPRLRRRRPPPSRRPRHPCITSAASTTTFRRRRNPHNTTTRRRRRLATPSALRGATPSSRSSSRTPTAVASPSRAAGPRDTSSTELSWRKRRSSRRSSSAWSRRSSARTRSSRGRPDPRSDC